MLITRRPLLVPKIVLTASEARREYVEGSIRSSTRMSALWKLAYW